MSNQGARRYLLWLKNRYVLTILEYVSWGHRWPAGGSHSYAEIASDLNVKPESARMALTRARRAALALSKKSHT